MKWMLLWAQLYYILCFWCFPLSFNKTLSTLLQKRKCMPLSLGAKTRLSKKKNLHNQSANQLVHPSSGEFLEIATEFERFGLQKKNYLMARFMKCTSHKHVIPLHACEGHFTLCWEHDIIVIEVVPFSIQTYSPKVSLRWTEINRSEPKWTENDQNRPNRQKWTKVDRMDQNWKLKGRDRERER